MNLTYINPARKYYNEEVHCGGAKGDSVKLELTGCRASLSVGEIKVYEVPHCHDAEDRCGESCNVYLQHQTVQLNCT